MLRSLGLGFIVLACVLLASVSSAQQTLSGFAGAVNAALFAAAILATTDPALAERLDTWRANQTGAVATEPVGAPDNGGA